ESPLVAGRDVGDVSAGEVLRRILCARRPVGGSDALRDNHPLQKEDRIEAVNLGVWRGMLDDPGAKALPHADLEDNARPDLLQEPVEGERADPAESLEILKRAGLQEVRELIQRSYQLGLLRLPLTPGLHVHRAPSGPNSRWSARLRS